MKAPENITQILWKKSFCFLEKSISTLVIGGVIAGILVGLAAITSLTGTSDMPKYFGVGFTKIVSGIVFSFGLITIVLSGSELFTGSNIYIISLFKSKKNLIKILRNWVIIYCSNFIGSLVLVFIIAISGVYKDETIASTIVRSAELKLQLTWIEAFTRGILCNFLVCLAIRVGEASEEVSGKILGYIVVIGAFVINAFEHSVANMFTIPTGIILGGKFGVNLSWKSFFLNNLIPVTLGNIMGGGVFIGCCYYLLHKDACGGVDVWTQEELRL